MVLLCQSMALFERDNSTHCNVCLNFTYGMIPNLLPIQVQDTGAYHLTKSIKKLHLSKGTKLFLMFMLLILSNQFRTCHCVLNVN